MTTNTNLIKKFANGDKLIYLCSKGCDKYLRIFYLSILVFLLLLHLDLVYIGHELHCGCINFVVMDMLLVLISWAYFQRMFEVRWEWTLGVILASSLVREYYHYISYLVDLR